VAQPIDILQPGTAAQHTVGQRQHVIGLVIRQMNLQQVQVGVNRPHQAQPGHQPVHREQPTKRRRLDVAANLVADLLRGQHRR
jgi:hypothetical protein